MEVLNITRRTGYLNTVYFITDEEGSTCKLDVRVDAYYQTLKQLVSVVSYLLDRGILKVASRFSGKERGERIYSFSKLEDLQDFERNNPDLFI